jgi:mRNA interferase MazF
MAIKRFDVYMIELDPTVASRPCVVISADELNRNMQTVIVAPMTTKASSSPTRISCRFKEKAGEVVLDQLRTVDRVRLIKKLGRLDNKTADRILEVLQEMFAP